MKFGILGSGSWGTALAKILTDNGQTIHWWNRSESAIEQFKTRFHNPQYLPSARFNINQLKLTSKAIEVIQQSDTIVIAIPSAYAAEVLSALPAGVFEGKKIVSAIKGILPDQNLLLNDYLKQQFNFPARKLFCSIGSLSCRRSSS
jgi:glycerol-3-phosphate dehydrogenase (NAD(P)+)